MAVFGIVSEIKRDISRKSRLFHTPPAFDVPVMGDPSEFRHNITYGKTRIMGLKSWKKFEVMFVDTIHERERKTLHRHRPRYVWHRATKTTYMRILLHDRHSLRGRGQYNRLLLRFGETRLATRLKKVQNDAYARPENLPSGSCDLEL